MQAGDKHEFIKENKYIYYNLLELQELLVKGGYINPEEAFEMNEKQPYDIRMERAS
jgi:hypothetical protein